MLVDGAAERPHVLLTLPLRFAIEGPKVLFEQISPVRPEDALAKRSDDPFKQMVRP